MILLGLEGTLGKVGTGGGKKLSMSKINIGKGKDKKKEEAIDALTGDSSETSGNCSSSPFVKFSTSPCVVFM